MLPLLLALALQAPSGAAVPTAPVPADVREAQGPAPAGSVSRARALDVVDPTTLTGKVLFGYQGWFRTPGDGSPFSDWRHWFRNNDLDQPEIEFWPDLDEVAGTALEGTGLPLIGGGEAFAYSSWDPSTVDLHFSWMRDYGTDGAFIGRFMGAVATNPNLAAFRDRVLESAADAAFRYGRVYAINYDVSDGNDASWLQATLDDWNALLGERLGSDPRYLRHAGKPVVKVFGIGFDKSTGFTSSEALAFVEELRLTATVIGGVSTNWRTLEGDARDDDDGVTPWSEVYEAFDYLSPWSVTRFSTPREAATYLQNRLLPDLAYLDQLEQTTGRRVGYYPVLWPGFSWRNLQLSKGNDVPANAIPREGGSFYWAQAHNVLSTEPEALLLAQFDEVDEGTQMFKTAATAADTPNIPEREFLALDADGYDLPTDWYLQLARETAAVLRGEQTLERAMPIEPALHVESGELQLDSPSPGAFRRVFFEAPFLEPPVVVTGPLTSDSDSPAVVRVGEVTEAWFDVRLDEWDYLDGVVTVPDRCAWIALPEGTHELGGLRLQAGRVAAQAELPWTTRPFDQDFDAAPAVLAQVRSADNPVTLAPRLRSITANGFQVRVQDQEVNATPPPPVDLDFIAVEPGEGSVGGRLLRVGRAGGFTDAPAPLELGVGFGQPLVFATLQTVAGSDPCSLRRGPAAAGSGAVPLRVEEENSDLSEGGGAGETAHAAAEDVGWLAIEG